MSTKRTLIGNIKGPKGDTGAQGPQGATGPGATIEVGTVSTTAYGNTAQVTNSGTETAAVLDFVIPQGKPGEQTTKMSGLTLDTVTASTADYPIPATGDTGSVAWGKVIKFFNDAKTAIASKINISDIVNNLTSTATNKPLSAAQGKKLNDAIATLTSLKLNILKQGNTCDTAYPSESPGVAFYVSNGDVTARPNNAWFFIISFRAESTYITQVAFGMTTSAAYYRRFTVGTTDTTWTQLKNI